MEKFFRMSNGSNRSKFAAFAKEASALFAWEGTKGVLWLLIAGGASILAHRFLRAPLSVHSLPLALCCFGFGILITVPTIYICRRIWFYPALRKQRLDFRQVKRELSFEYREDGKTFIYQRAILLKPLRHGLTEYRNKFMWTGKTPPSVECAAPYAFRLLERKGVWQYYEIDFRRAVNLTDEIETLLTFTMNDPHHTFTPFISATIDEPTDKLVMSLSIPTNFGTSEATCEIAYNMGANIPLSTEVKRLDYHGRVSWVIPKPKMHHYYELRWHEPSNWPPKRAHEEREVFHDTLSRADAS